jgi:hypothetical protein
MTHRQSNKYSQRKFLSILNKQKNKIFYMYGIKPEIHEKTATNICIHKKKMNLKKKKN